MSLKNTCASLVVVDTVILLGLSGLLSTGSRRVDTVILLGLTGLLSTGSRRIGGGVENVEGRPEESDQLYHRWRKPIQRTSCHQHPAEHGTRPVAARRCQTVSAVAAQKTAETTDSTIRAAEVLEVEDELGTKSHLRARQSSCAGPQCGEAPLG